jgi:hypothetical protein
MEAFTLSLHERLDSRLTGDEELLIIVHAESIEKNQKKSKEYYEIKNKIGKYEFCGIVGDMNTAQIVDKSERKITRRGFL